MSEEEKYRPESTGDQKKRLIRQLTEINQRLVKQVEQMVEERDELRREAAELRRAAEREA